MFGCCADLGGSVWHGVCDDVALQVCGLCLGVVMIFGEVCDRTCEASGECMRFGEHGVLVLQNGWADVFCRVSTVVWLLVDLSEGLDCLVVVVERSLVLPPDIWVDVKGRTLFWKVWQSEQTNGGQ